MAKHRQLRTKPARTRTLSLDDVLAKLSSLSDPRAVAGMVRFGISPKGTLGISIPSLRGIAGEIGRDHLLAQRLWSSGFHEARILAGFIDEPELVTERQMEDWVRMFDSWDVCDQVCGSLFEKTRFAYKKAAEWSQREEEFVKRAAFALMASLAVHDKEADDHAFVKFLPIIKRASGDDRNFVRKAVNWALRQIGKRNLALNKLATQTAMEIQKMNARSAKWIASDALRELTNEKILDRLRQ